jgi:hypothetical protein
VASFQPEQLIKQGSNITMRQAEESSISVAMPFHGGCDVVISYLQ